jgi:hypothetical protein
MSLRCPTTYGVDPHLPFGNVGFPRRCIGILLNWISPCNRGSFSCS